MPLHQNQMELLLEPVSSMTISANSCQPWIQVILKPRTDSRHETNAGDEKNIQNNVLLNRIVEQSNNCFRLDHGSWSNGPSVATFNKPQWLHIQLLQCVSACDFWVCLHGLHSELVRVTNVHRPNCRFLIQIPLVSWLSKIMASQEEQELWHQNKVWGCCLVH